MDLIYTNKAREDLGVLQDYDMDLAFGSDENNFECTVSAASHCCEEGSLLYMEGTEYGGIVDGIESDTASKEVKYNGRTWHGILESKIILPLQESDNEDPVASDGIRRQGTCLIIVEGVMVRQKKNALYITDASSLAVTIEKANDDGSLMGKYLIISGDANDCIQFIIERSGLSSLFSTDGEAAGVNITEYQFHRFTDAYSGLVKMLESAGLKLHTEFHDGVVVLSTEAKRNYTTDEEFDSDLVDFKATKKFNAVNHLICLGSGELENRMVIHLYADKDGNISREQTQTGLDEYVGVFDCPNAESADELIKDGTERLKKLWDPVTLTIDFDDTTDSYDVGDIVGAYDSITGISASAVITKKIVTIKNGQITISYKVGD